MKLIYLHGINESDTNGDDLKLDWDIKLFGAPNPDTMMAFWGDLSVLQTKTESLSFQDELLNEIFKVGTGTHLLKDCQNYFYDQSIRAAIQDRFIRLLPGPSEPFMVVSHSLGTTIAYEVLLERQNSLLVDSWITIGCPNGIDVVQAEIRRQNSLQESPVKIVGEKLPIPDCVIRWDNYSDLEDPVALVHQLDPHFTPGKLCNTISDNIVKNPMAPEKPHNIDGYLQIEQIRTRVKEELNP